MKNIDKQFKQSANQTIALEDVSLTINSQELFGIVGESGSGKSTLLRIINHLEQPDAGQVLIDGLDISQLSRAEQRLQRQKIGMIFQQFNLLGNLTVADNVALPLKLQQRPQPEIVDEMLAFVNMSTKRAHYPAQLSGGEKQRVAIARALSFKPSLLLCDEPTSALDDQHGEEIINLLQHSHKQFKTTIVIVSHEFNVIRSLCQRAAILDQGRLLDVVPVSAATKAPNYTSYYQRALAGLGQ